MFDILFKFMWRCMVFAVMAAFIQPGIALMEFLGIIKPSTETIIFEELLSTFRDRESNAGHEDQPGDIKRFDAFYQHFNMFRAQYVRRLPLRIFVTVWSGIQTATLSLL